MLARAPSATQGSDTAPDGVGTYTPSSDADAPRRPSVSTLRPNPLTLWFPGETELDFSRDDFEKSLTRTRVVLVLGVVLYCTFGVGDAIVFPAFRAQLWTIRYAIALPVGVACVLFTYSPAFRRWRHLALSAFIATGAGGILAMIAIVPQSGAWLSSGSWLYYVGLLLVVIYYCALLRLRFVHAVVTSALILGAYVGISLWRTPAPVAVLANNFFALFVAVVLGLSANYVMERFERVNFIQRRVIDARTEELQRRNDELREANLRIDRSRAELLRSARRTDLIFAALSEALPGRVLDDKYRVDELIGSGGFGTVYRGLHLQLQHPVALKVFRPLVGRGVVDGLERFRLEGIAACRVHHPNAVTVLDFGVAGGAIAYLVMELLEGRSLADELLDKGPLSPIRCAEIIGPVCDVLAQAHAAGIIHRDIKPSNIFLHRAGDGETTKVIDFGIAKLVSDTSDFGLRLATASGTVVGTIAYIAPERIADRPYDGGADVYALGVTVYEMLCGCLPFEPAEQSEWVTAVLHAKKPIPALSQLNPLVPRPLEELVMRALAKDPRRRPSASEFGRELRRWAGVAVAV